MSREEIRAFERDIESRANPLTPNTQREIQALLATVKAPVRYSDDPIEWAVLRFIPDEPWSAMSHRDKLIWTAYDEHSPEWPRIFAQSKVDSIVLPRMRHDGNYYTLLHELGHYFTGSGDETRATQWAYEHAGYWNALMTMIATRSMVSHVENGDLPYAKVESLRAQLLPKGASA